MSRSRASSVDNSSDEQVAADEKRRAPAATWRTLPRKGQLCILGLCRLVDFLQVSSLQAYLFYQLKSLDTTLPVADISWQAGILQGSFTAAQCFTAVLWGRAADSPWCGRKTVLLIGLFSTALSCVGLGLSTSFAQAVVFRTLGGGLNGTVGIIFQSRAFLILPISFNLAAFIGPVLGGFLADTDNSSQVTLETESKYVEKPRYISHFPYALPNIVNAVLLFAATLIVYLGLEETLQSRKDRFDIGRYLGKRLISIAFFFQSLLHRKNTQIRDIEECEATTSLRRGINFTKESVLRDSKEAKDKHSDIRLPFYRIWTSNVISMLLAEALFDFHLGAFSSLLPLFLSSPAVEPETHDSLRLIYAPRYESIGGLSMPAASAGIALAFLGGIGLALQVTVFPIVHSRLGTVQCFRLFSAIFPIAYAALPFLSLLPSEALRWAGIVLVLSILVTARTFTLPATIVLLNNCSPHPSVLGTVHAIGQAVSALFRTVGSVIGGSWYGISLQSGSVREAWWNVGVVAIFGFLVSCLVTEGSGHEIILPGE